MNISELIKNRRLELGLTLEQVAEKVGVGKSTVRKWENGTIQDMKRTNAIKLADALNLGVAYLFVHESEPNNNLYRKHHANLSYFTDKPELLELYKDIHENESLRLLFDSANNLKPEDLEIVLNLIKRLKGSDDE